NIYKGRVSKVLPGMQSAFVDLGLERDAFLYVTDVIDPTAESLEDEDEPALEPVPVPESGAEADIEALAHAEAGAAEAALEVPADTGAASDGEPGTSPSAQSAQPGGGQRR